MALTISLKAGHILTESTDITIPLLNELFSLGYGTVDSGSVENGDIADEAVTLGKMADLDRGSIIHGATANNRPAALSLLDGKIVIGDGTDTVALDVKTSGQIIVGNGTTATSVAVSGNATLASDGTLTVTNAYGRYYKHNLVVTNNASNSDDIDVDADEIVLRDAAAGDNKLFASVDVTIDVSSTTYGANAREKNTALGTQWWYVWLIGKTDGTIAGMLSTSATSPDMDAAATGQGYTYKRLVGEVYYDTATAAETYRQDDSVDFAVPQEGLEATFPVYASPTTLDLSAIVPAGCTRLRFEGGTTNLAQNTNISVSPNSDRDYVASVESRDTSDTAAASPCGLHCPIQISMKCLGGQSVYVSSTTAAQATAQGLWVWGYDLPR